MKRSMVIMKKATEFEFTLVARFARDEDDQGGITYDLKIVEDWGDGHCTHRKSISFGNDKARADGWYRDLKRDGYVLLKSYSLEPSQMDVR